ncbi:uncharacterized protein LOC108261589 [Ictalurus punctatus]|uniref:Uncharacterized protein LOC108261589 n=1 Tax=Ictalurus punctatus TaxID=7998 RepID=A0A979EGF0_ICTPU|nr:uncharacterized protein LOC108261589 [Ictalurus punctatus]
MIPSSLFLFQCSLQSSTGFHSQIKLLEYISCSIENSFKSSTGYQRSAQNCPKLWNSLPFQDIKKQKREQAMCIYFLGHFFLSSGYESTLQNRLIIFLTTGFCAGFLALLLALGVLYHHHKSRGRISFIAIFLLLSDLLELILSPVLLTYIFNGNADWIHTVITLLFAARFCGHVLHQVVALESIVTVKFPSVAVIFSNSCSITFCIFVWLLAIGCQFIQNAIIYAISMCLFVLPVTTCAACIVTFKAPLDTTQATARKPGGLVLSVAMFTLIILYVPFFLDCLLITPFMLNCLVSMRLISEPLLCIFICRENRN